MFTVDTERILSSIPGNTKRRWALSRVFIIFLANSGHSLDFPNLFFSVRTFYRKTFVYINKMA